MPPYDDILAQELLAASTFLSSEQQSWLQSQWATLPQEKKDRVFALLIKEQNARTKSRQDRQAAQRKHAAGQLQVMGRWNQSAEAQELERLWSELMAVFDAPSSSSLA